MGTADWTQVIEDAMAGLGLAADVSRVVVFERNPSTDGEVFVTQVYEWAASSLALRIDDPTITRLPLLQAGFRRWVDQLGAGAVVRGNVRDFPDGERRQLALHGIRSIAVVPIPVEGDWWGFIAFDDCVREREWLPEETDALQAAANILGGAIRRKAADDRQAALENQVRHLQKMEAVGQLAGGVAHDFNNILTAILGYCDLLLSHRAIQADGRVWIEEIARASERAARLTRQLLTFSRQQVVQPAVFNLDLTVAELQKMLRRLIGEHIGLTIKHGVQACDIYADPGQIEQVIMNLAVNARDAMPRGGTIVVEVRRAKRDERPDGWSADIAGDEHVLLSISDTGSGMSDEVKQHLFEPFFTTKAIGKGTGLGLSTVYGIVRQAGGAVTFTSELGGGTTFQIHLPLAVRPAAAADTAKPRLEGGSETVLLVEDDPTVRTLACTFLTKLGYVVIQAADGGAAVRVASTHSGPLDLLLTDVVMPVASGKDVADALVAIRPGLPVLYMSGYTDGDIGYEGRFEHGATFLQKPFTFETLARAVRTALA